MGDFTDLLTKGKNGSTGKAIPIGSTHYQMAGISFYLNQSPKDMLGQLVQAMIQQLAQQGQHEAANQMLKNPQPFYGNPHALAVFMAASVELEKRDQRIEALETAVAGLAGAFTEADGMDPEAWYRQVMRPATQEALGLLKREKEAADGEG